MKRRLGPALRHVPRLAVAAFFLLPLYWMLTGSLRPPDLPPSRTVDWWPTAPEWRNFLMIFQIIPMARYAANSAIVAVVAVPVTILTASMAGFGLSQLENRSRRRVLATSIGLMLIPGVAIWLFCHQILRGLHLIDSLPALFVTAFAGGNPLYVLLYYWTFRLVPPEIIEAARLEGAGAISIWWQIARPLARPTTAAVSLLSFSAHWGDFSSPVLYVYRPDLYTLPIGLQILNQIETVGWPLLMAAAVVATAPALCLFLLVERSLMEKLSLGDPVERG